MEPCWWHDIGTTLFLKEEGEPEGKLGTMWWSEGGSCALDRDKSAESSHTKKARLRSVRAGRTLRRSILSSRPLGTTVTISISQRNETSAGVRPGGCGWAILDYSRLPSCHGGRFLDY